MWRRITTALSRKKETVRFEAFEARTKALEDRISALETELRETTFRKKNLYVPAIDIHPTSECEFMEYSTCNGADFLNPRYHEIARILRFDAGSYFHRKAWEWAFIYHHAVRTGAVGGGKRALGFGVGTEPLSSAFAALGCSVTATDAPEEVVVDHGWESTGQYAGKLEDLHRADIVDAATFRKNVAYDACDMNDIPERFAGYDFCWSSCAFEHLGDLAKGLDFVLNSVEKTLRPGGVACHTTELNLTSDTETMVEGWTVLYRKSDLTAFIERLEQRGHRVLPLRIAPDTHTLDFYVDTPPYARPHLKLQLEKYVSTSVGLVITRGG